MHTPEQYRLTIEQALAGIPFPATPAGLGAPVHYALACGGKRLRPMLTLAMAEALGSDIASALNPALAIEVYHNFTLLHDDVMDHADLRRGRPTVHRKFGETAAILSGDAMLTFATMLLAKDAPDNRLCQMLALFDSTAMDVYRGQQYDVDFESRTDVTEDEYIEMIRLKTSVLVGCACRMGAIVAGASAGVQQACYDYGEQLGLAFQLRDDYLDTYGDVELFGKEVGGDILNDKKTWLSVKAMADAGSQAIFRLFGPAANPAGKIESVRAIYDRAHLPGQIRRLIDHYSAAADRALATVEMSGEARGFFTRLTRQLSSRVV